jgi:glucosyl-dolichyl phosphate glucuronosyltransferase
MRKLELLQISDVDRIFGGNMIWRKDILRLLNGFDTNRGMKGNKPGYGEESALLLQLKRSMPHESVYYIPELYVYHLVQLHKFTLSYSLRASFRAGRDFFNMQAGCR